MKLSWWLFSIALAFNLFLALSPLLPFTAFIWQSETPEQFYRVLTAFIGIAFLLLTGALGAIVLQEMNRIHEPVNKLVDTYPIPPVRRLRDDHFYAHFLASAKTAQHTVLITYFAPHPPSMDSDMDRRRYYDDILRVIHGEQKVQFKRIVRYSPQNVTWLVELLNVLEGQSNAHLAVLRCDLPQDKRMGLALAVQVIDDDKAWLVAVASHERQGSYRDVYIENIVVASALTAYFNRLWDASEVLLRAGTVTDKGQALRTLGGGSR